MTDEADAVRNAERAGLYIGAIAVMAREFRRRVSEAVITPDEPWLGHVHMPAELATRHDKKQAKLGKTDGQRRVQEAAMILMSGAVALDLLEDSNPPLFTTDPLVMRARKMLIESTFWAAEAAAALTWLRHRTVASLACARQWRLVAGVAEALMADTRLSERYLNQLIGKISTGRMKSSRQWVICLDLKSAELLNDSASPPASQPLAEAQLLLRTPITPPKEATDALVTRDVHLGVAKQFNTPGQLSKAMERLKEREPVVFWAIQQEAGLMDEHFRRANTPPVLTAAAAVIRCGTLVAELLYQGHARLWATAEDQLPKQD